MFLFTLKTDAVCLKHFTDVIEMSGFLFYIFSLSSVSFMNENPYRFCTVL